ncbi:MAG: NAD(P)/FAD-dependent oxidoreductase [Vicinamibacteria bacterium]
MRAVGLALGATLLSGPPARADEPRASAPVVVVGAGLTGLTTAYELRKAGIDVLLLEAAPRPGGRIQTVSFPDGTHVEAHMEEYWERSPAYPLLKELNLPLEEDVAHSTLRIAGRIYPYQGEGDRDTYLRGIFSEPERLALLRWNAAAWDAYQRLSKFHEGHGPLPADLAKLQKVSLAAWVRGFGLPKKAAEWIRATVEPEMAIEWDQIAALDGIDEMRLFLDTPQGFGEKNFHVSGGNTRFVEALVERVGRERIVTEAQVTAIQQSAAGARVRYLHEGARYREVEARAVVVTVPLYHLRRIQFEPALSADKQKAIETTRFGAYIKVHLRVAAEAAPLWHRDGETLLTMLSDSPAGSIYEATAFQANEPGADRYLTMLVHARFAHAMLGQSADGMRAHAVKSLDAIFPGIARHVKLVELFVYPTAVAWWPLALGRSRYDALAQELRRPQGRVWIGGDTTENSHSEGAVQAAQRMAREIAARQAELLAPVVAR